MTQQQPTATVTKVGRLAIATPADWMVLPLDDRDRDRDRRIARMVERRMGKDDRLAHVRLPIVAQLRKYAREAAEKGAFLIAMHGRMVRDVPLSSTVVASWLPLLVDRDGQPLPDADSILSALAPGTEKGEVLEQSVIDLPVGRATRVRRRTKPDIQDMKGEEIYGESFDYFVPIAEVDRTLVLICSTPILPLADAYAVLFDTLAGTIALLQDPDEDQSDDEPTDNPADRSVAS